VPTDVTDERAMIDLADAAFDRHGRLDVWVNNASVATFATIEKLPMEEMHQVFETNVYGYVHGAKAVLPIFEVLGRGVLINVASMVGKVPAPYAGAYVMSKHAVVALGQVLRQELMLEHQRHIDVCTVMPATIDTPFFQHAANHTGRQVVAMPPVYRPERVAETIVACARTPRREVYVGGSARMIGLQSRVAPGMTERLMAQMVDKLHLSVRGGTPPSSGNLYAPTRPSGVHGGWRDRNRALQGAAAFSLAAAGLALARRNHEPGPSSDLLPVPLDQATLPGLAPVPATTTAGERGTHPVDDYLSGASSADLTRSR
jgi:short-subunit dehydrogenase